MSDLHLAEIPFDDGSLRFRYARKLSADGTRWIRQGPFQAFHPNGSLASEGAYHDGLEQGVWRDFHDNGQIAAEGSYHAGNKDRNWRYWGFDGSEEAPDEG